MLNLQELFIYFRYQAFVKHIYFFSQSVDCLLTVHRTFCWQKYLILMFIVKYVTSLSDFTFTFHFYALEKEMATHSSLLAWRILGMAEPGGLLSIWSHRVRHDWSDTAAELDFERFLQFLTYVLVLKNSNHLLKRLSFLHCIFLPPLSKIRCP